MRIAILWHMHQPDYRHPGTGDEEMPWVRLHALKDYYDMARLAEEAPASVRVTFNLTPVLLLQLEQLCERGPRDPFYRICRRPVSSLGIKDRLFLLDNFFSVNAERMIRPVPRYQELYDRIGDPEIRLVEIPGEFDDRDYLDLQVLFHLAWCGRTLREDPLVRELLDQGESYTEHQRDALLDVQDRFLEQVIPTYARLWESGRIELSTTPLNHPILPLLCDLRSAKEANRSCPVEELTFRYPEDARVQVSRGLETVRRLLGRAPSGMWPSEGAVSDAALRILEGEDIRWIATDQQVLERSLALTGTQVDFPPHLRTWRLRGTEGPVIFFRDTDLSDRIGFTYSRWNPEDAVKDFLSRARRRTRRDPDPTQACLPVILDGENAWEFYPEGGLSFLRALYEGLAESEDLDPVTFSQALSQTPVEVLPRLRTGSWIAANLDTWIGHPEKNRAWEMLVEARREFEDRRKAGTMAEEDLARAASILYQAEASDWFWWMGDDHPTYYKFFFDEFFRGTLQCAWRALDRPPPAALYHPIPEADGASTPQARPPIALIEPNIDGRDTSFYEWVGCGTLETDHQSGAIFTGEPSIRRIDFGFGTGALYLRLVPHVGPAGHLFRDARLQIFLRAPGHRQEWQEWIVYASSGGRLLSRDDHDQVRRIGNWAMDRVYEIRIDLDPLSLASGDALDFHLELSLPDGQTERQPLQGTLTTRVPGPDLDRRNWSL